MSGEADDSDIVGEVFTAELSAESEALSGFEEFFLEFDIAESATVFIAGGREVVVIFDACLLDGGEVGFGRSAADDESDMIRGASGSAEGLHLSDEEGHESLFIKDSLGLLIEICFVGGAAPFGNEEELVFITLASVDFDLRGEVAAGVDLIIHGEGCVLRISEIVFSISLVYAERDFFFVIASGPNLLTLVSGADRCAGVLTEREDAFSSDLGIAQHGESYKLVVFACLRVIEYFGNHLIVFAAQHKRAVVRSDVGQKCKSFRFNDEHFVAAPVFDRDIVFGNQLIFRSVRTHLKGLLIMEGFCRHRLFIFVDIVFRF